jgi:hypothetical protein
MKLTIQRRMPAALWLFACIACLCMSCGASAQGFTTTTVQGTVYLANGQTGSGVLQLTWPAFTTANNQAVAAGRMNIAIGADGYVTVKLSPNQGATPAGLYYTAVYHLSDGTTSTEYWVVPAAAQASLSQVRAQVMPAAQAVQAVSKGYVDQSITELTQSLLTASGGSLSGPLFLNGDPTQPAQAATKRYVDNEFANALPASGGAASGPLTSVQLGAAYQVDQFSGADFGAKLQSCLNHLDAVYGGTCDARNFTGSQTMGSTLVIATANATVQLPCATIATAKQIRITASTRNVTFHGCALRGASKSSGSQGGTVLLYSGAGPMIQVGDPTYAVDTLGFHIDNVVINATASTDGTAQGLAAYRTQEMNLEGLYLLGNSNQTGMTLDGTGNYTGGTFQDIEFNGFGTALNALGHQVSNEAPTDWVNASTFVRLHINCPTSSGSPISGTVGINLLQGDGNTFTGGDVEGCGTALHLGPNAQNNTIVGLRNENSLKQVVADAGSSYNNWMTGGTMFTGQLSDSGTRNSFLDTFHRSFNGLNGDWYGSQADATITNHYRIGTGTGNERGLLNRFQSDYGYRWTTGLSDATGGEQFYQVLDELNNVNRLSIGQYNHGEASTNNQTVINAAGTGAVVLNGSANAGTGGVIIGSGGAAGSTVATINSAGNAQFNGTLQVGGPSTFVNSTTVKNLADAEIDSVLWAGATTNQKESFIYKDYLGTSQWYLVKDASNNWAVNSALGGLDSFKAYQSNNSGDTYINASNATGHIRLNYESGSGSETDIYSGPSSTLVAAFLGSTAIKFPGLASSSGRYCLQIDNSGYLSNTGAACGSGSGGGTVNSGNSGQVAYYAGNGTVIAGTTSVPLTAGGTGATSAAQALANLGAQAALSGVNSDGASGLVVSGNVTAGTAVANVNRVISVIAPPYNGKCDGTTDDQAAIQAAFNAAQAGNASVQFPAGICKTSTIAWKGQSFFGAGITHTTIKGMPGQDVFQTPDGNTWTPPVNGTLVHNLWIQVDNSVDASGSSHGNNTFPNRIAGTLGGTSNIITPVIATGPVVFGTYSGTYPNGAAFSLNTQCAGTINGATLNKITFSGVNCLGSGNGAGLNRLDSWRVVGAPITVKGVGAGGSDLVTTISSVDSTGLTITMAAPATSSGSGLSGSYLNPVNDGPDAAHWYLTIGNCGFAFPNSNGAAASPNLGRFVFEDVMISSINGPWQGNHSCGMFVQAPPYAMKLTNVVISAFYGGYVEALPAANPNSSTWTGDTSSFTNDDFQFSLFPMIIMGGNHRTFSGINFYGGAQYQAMGPMWLHHGSSATVSRVYFECGSSSGEISRYTGDYGINIEGGSLNQCQQTGYVLWNASRSNVNAQISSLQIAAGANMNTFTHTAMPGAWAADSGQGNSIETNGNSSPFTTSARQFFTNRPVDPVGRLKGGFLTSGNSAASYLNADDLFTTCLDWSIANQSPAVYGTCVPDPTGTEVNHSYFQSVGATTTFDLLNNGGAPNMWTGSQRFFGSSVPQTKAMVYVLGECVGASSCTTTLTVKDGTTNGTIATGSMTFTGSWTLQSMAVDFTSTTYGDGLDFRFGSWVNAGTNYNLAWIGIQPVNVDEHSWLAINGLPTTGGNIPVASTTGARLCTGPANGVIAGHIFTATGTNGACDLQDGGALPQAIMTSVPTWMQWYGDGSDGPLNITSGTSTITSGVHYYTTCNISAGATGAVTTMALVGAPAILFCNAATTIAGTLSFSQNTGASSGISGNANFGGQGGGGGGGTGAGNAGGSINGAGGGTGGTASGGTGGSGTSPSAQLQRLLLTFGSNNLGSFQCGGSSGGAGGTGAAAGGRGGGCVIVISPSINFSGTIDVSGANGTNSNANNQGGGGGGGGGAVILRSPSMTNSGTFTLIGGSGGGCGAYSNCGAGGTGASGWSKVFTQ